MAEKMTVTEFLGLEPRRMDGYFAEHVLGYTRMKVPPDAFGENGGDDFLVPPGGIPNGFTLPPKGRIHFAYMAPELATDRWQGETLRDRMAEFGYRRTLETGNDVRVTWTNQRDERTGTYYMPDRRSHLVCALVAACIALGALTEEVPTE